MTCSLCPWHSEKPQLSRRPKTAAIVRRQFSVQPAAPGEEPEHVADLLGDFAGSTHAAAELGVVSVAAPRSANPPFDFMQTGGERPLQPLSKYGGNGKRKTQ